MPVFVGPAAPSLAFATCVACSWATVASELARIAERPSSTPRRSEAASFLSAAPLSVSPVVPGLVASAAATLELANYPGALRKRQDMGSVVHQGRRMNGTVLAPERPFSGTSARPRQCCGAAPEPLMTSGRSEPRGEAEWPWRKTGCPLVPSSLVVPPKVDRSRAGSSQPGSRLGHSGGPYPHSLHAVKGSYSTLARGSFFLVRVRFSTVHSTICGVETSQKRLPEIV